MQITRAPSSNKEPTIALINIVFLMLIFFMIAGTLAPPLASELSLIETRDLDGREPPDTLVVHADGHLTLRGDPVTDVVAFISGLRPEQIKAGVRIVPDRALPAHVLVQIGTDLRRAGAQQVFIISQRGLE